MQHPTVIPGGRESGTDDDSHEEVRLNPLYWG